MEKRRRLKVESGRLKRKKGRFYSKTGQENPDTGKAGGRERELMWNSGTLKKRRRQTTGTAGVCGGVRDRFQFS